MRSRLHARMPAYLTTTTTTMTSLLVCYIALVIGCTSWNSVAVTASAVHEVAAPADAKLGRAVRDTSHSLDNEDDAANYAVPEAEWEADDGEEVTEEEKRKWGDNKARVWGKRKWGDNKARIWGKRLSGAVVEGENFLDRVQAENRKLVNEALMSERGGKRKWGENKARVWGKRDVD